MSKQLVARALASVKEIEAALHDIEAENTRLRAALRPMIEGTYWITPAQIETARALLTKVEK